MKYAIVANNIVEGLVVQAVPPVFPGKTVVPAKGPVQVGWIYIPADRGPEFFRPDMPARPQRETIAQQVNQITAGSFLLRFTEAERSAIRVAAAAEWAARVAGQVQAAPLSDFLYLLEHFPVIDKNNLVVSAGLAALVTAGLLGANRPAELLA